MASKKQTIKPRNGGEWTEARYRSFVTSALRSASRRWPPKYAALRDALLGRKENKKTGKLAQHYRCAACTGEFVANDVQVDHIHPVVDPDVGFVSWDKYIENMYCEVVGFQILCLDCHKAKTLSEKLKRKSK